MEDVPIGIILLDENGLIIFANHYFLKTFLCKKGEMEGKRIETFLAFPLKNKHQAAHTIFTGASPGKKQIFAIKNKHDKVYRVEIGTNNSEFAGINIYLGILMDDERELRNELKKQINLNDTIQDELEQENELSEMKSRFLSIASHEFRTPLAGILSSLNLIKRYLDADQQAWAGFRNKAKIVNHLNKINESVQNLTAILQKFLALGNIEKGEIPVKYAKINLKENLEKQRLQIQEICKPGQKISYRHIGQRTTVALDKYLLKNILINLLSNAIHYSHENSEIQLISEVKTETVSIIVKDEGIGIPEAEQKRVFRRFFRANNAMTFQEGTGLGLNIVKNYVERMNGNITFESRENMGTTFYVTFPNKKI
jgi:PAS domain S-box-containing protein